MARKKFSHVSLLHVVHHGIMPMSVWPGARFVPGGHASFFGFLNTFVHIFMYLYYLFAALGPQYQRYIWWKQHMTTLQMVQFVAIMTHGFQLVLYDDCDFPWQFSYYIGAHAILFFVLFSQFYIREYLSPDSKKKGKKALAGKVEVRHFKQRNSCSRFFNVPSLPQKNGASSNGISNGYQNGEAAHAHQNGHSKAANGTTEIKKDL